MFYVLFSCTKHVSMGEWVQNGFVIVLWWHSTYGFDLNNREIASLFWLILFGTGVLAWLLSKPSQRSTLVDALRIALGRKMLPVWICYISWVIILLWITNLVGIWRPILTKDTLIWIPTAGIVLLIGSKNPIEPGYFRQKLSQVVGLVVIFQYIANFATFSLWIELILQPILSILVILLSYTEVSNGDEKARSLLTGILAVVILVILGNSLWKLYVSWNIIQVDLFLLQFFWSIVLGIWILIFAFPLAIYMGYEQAFNSLERYRDEDKGVWKAKLGLLLSFRFRLKWVREATEGGPYHIAHAESVRAAYQAAKDYKYENQP